MKYQFRINNKFTITNLLYSSYWVLAVFLIFFYITVSNCTKPTSTPSPVLIVTQPHDARIFIDGKFKGNSPLLYNPENKVKKKTSNTTVQIRIEKKNYYSYQKTLSLLPFLLSNINHPPREYTFDLIPVKRPFKINFSLPPQKVFLNHQLVKIDRQGRLNLKIPNGDYNLLAIRKNTPFLEHQFTLSDKSPKSIKLIFPKPKFPNRLTIRSPLDRENHKKDGVDIYYKQVKIGTTPITFNYLPIIPFQLVFTKQGRLQKTVAFSLHKREKRIVVIRLAKENEPSFNLNFNHLPIGSRIMLNNKIVALRDNRLKVPILAPLSPHLNSNPLRYSYRMDHPDYYPEQGYFYLPLTNQIEFQKNINLKPIKKVNSPKLIKKIDHGLDLLSAKVFPLNLNGFAGELFISDKKNQLTVYDESLNLKDQYDFSKVRTNNIPSLSHGFLRKGRFLLKKGVISSLNYFSNPEKFKQPRYLLIGATNSKFVVFNNGSHEINLWNHLKLEKTINSHEYPTEGFINPLNFGQAIWWNYHQFLVTDRLNRNIKAYDLITEKANYFIIPANDKPRQTYAIGKYHQLLAIAGLNKIYLYLGNHNLQGELLQIWDFPKIRNDKIEFLFFHHKKLILITTTKILLFRL